MDSGNHYMSIKNYDKALIKFQTAQIAERECGIVFKLEDSAKDPANKLKEVFKGLQAQRDEAFNQRNRANAALELAKEKTKIAEEKTNDATSLYWASESEQLIPMQGMRLLEKAYAKTKDENALSIIKEKIDNNFNGSNTHQYLEEFLLQNAKHIQFSPDGKWMVTRNKNRTANVWELSIGKQPGFLKEEKNINHVFFSPDSKWIVTINTDNATKIWELPGGKHPGFLKEEKNISGISFSSDSKWMVTSNIDNTAKVWELPGEKQPGFLKFEKNISYIYFSPDSKWMVTRNKDKTANVWELPDGKQNEFLKDEKNIGNIYFSPDSKWMVTRNRDTTAKVWNLPGGKQHNFL
ncbi:MAG: WD40 repeat domain-containing protein, partial [Ginsengibacter sp.]